MDVSIIVPVYNVESYIGECLKSVALQKVHCDIECIVVDDCGSDHSMDIVSKFIDSYNGPISFRIVRRKSNGGLSAARNSGIHVAYGNYLYFLDSDDLLTKDAICLLWDAVLKYPDVQIACGNFQTFPEKELLRSISLSGKNFPRYSNNIEWIKSVILSSFPITAWNKLISRKFIEEYNLYFREGIIHEDNHWHAMVYPFVESLAFVENTTYLYRIRPDSITQSIGQVSRRLTNMVLIYEEMFARKFEWDYYWTVWVFNCLNELKFPHKFGYDAEKASIAYKHLSNILVNNSSIPLIVRLMFRYHRLPRKFMRGKIINIILKYYYGK